MDDAGYGALAVALTLVSAAYTFWVFRAKGLGPGLRGVSLTLLVVAAYLTRTLRMFGRVVDAVVDWATTLVFNPVVWAGVAVAGVAVVVFLLSRILDGRGRTDETSTAPARAEQRETQAVAAAPQRRERSAPVDDDVAEIEAILKNRGIS